MKLCTVAVMSTLNLKRDKYWRNICPFHQQKEQMTNIGEIFVLFISNKNK